MIKIRIGEREENRKVGRGKILSNSVHERRSRRTKTKIR